jgi:hypothetical protein
MAKDAAYEVVDLAVFEPAQRAEIVNDALEGGGKFGIIVVEEFVNGPARQPVYGFYYDTPLTPPERQAEAKWREALARFGVAAPDPASSAEAVRAAAEAQADQMAAELNAREDEAVKAITKEPAATVNKAKL